jgi:curlin associated repeat protein
MKTTNSWGVAAMTRFKTLLSVAALAAMIGSAGVAEARPFRFAQVAANHAHVAQSGSANGAGISQNGVNLGASISQTGSQNGGVIRQVGRNNTASIDQAGDGNWGCIFQGGHDHNAGLDQAGDHHNLGLIQTGLGSYVVSVEECQAFIARNRAMMGGR